MNKCIVCGEEIDQQTEEQKKESVCSDKCLWSLGDELEAWEHYDELFI